MTTYLHVHSTIHTHMMYPPTYTVHIPVRLHTSQLCTLVLHNNSWTNIRERLFLHLCTIAHIPKLHTLLWPKMCNVYTEYEMYNLSNNDIYGGMNTKYIRVYLIHCTYTYMYIYTRYFHSDPVELMLFYVMTILYASKPDSVDNAPESEMIEASQN